MAFTTSADKKDVGTYSHKCQMCKNEYVKLKELKQHIRKHTREMPYECSLCGKGFWNSDFQYKHARRHNNLQASTTTEDKEDFNGNNCKVCGEVFVLKHHLKEHERHHKRETPFVCRNCGMNFTEAGEYSNHMRASKCHDDNLRSYKCPEKYKCFKSFRTHEQLVKHIKLHSAEDECTCPSCNKTSSGSDTNIPYRRECIDDKLQIYHKDYRANENVAYLKNDEVECHSSGYKSGTCYPSNESGFDNGNVPLDLRVPSRKHDEN